MHDLGYYTGFENNTSHDRYLRQAMQIHSIIYCLETMRIFGNNFKICFDEKTALIAKHVNNHRTKIHNLHCEVIICYLQSYNNDFIIMIIILSHYGKIELT